MTALNKSDAPQRLQKVLASSGAGSRRFCETLIAEGRVGVNGKTVTTPGITVTEQDHITLDGKVIRSQQHYYFMLHKPRGYLSSNSDPHHTRFARNLIQHPKKDLLFHVGRLDINSTGLMIFTNDGHFAHQLQHPSFEVEKEYYISVTDKIQEKDLKRAVEGVLFPDGIVYKLKRYLLLSDREVRVVLTEGKNREIRNLFASFGCTIDILHRIRIGSLEIGDLPPGGYREIEGDVVRSMLNRTMSKKDD